MKKSRFIRKIEKELKGQKELEGELPAAIYDCVNYLKKDDKEISVKDLKGSSASSCHICDHGISEISSHQIAIEDLFVKEFKKSTFDKSNVVGELLE